MPKQRLVINCNDQGQFFLLVEGDTITVGGTHGEAGTVLRHFRVLQVQCELEVEGDNVTCYNGEGPDNAQDMLPGEVIQVGASDLCLFDPDLNLPAEEEVGLQPPDEVGLRPTDQVSLQPAVAPAAEEASEPAMRKQLVVIDGADKGRNFPLPDSGLVTLGKDRKNADITLHDLYVARIHCLLKINGDQIEAVDEGRHGVLLNGQKIEQHPLNLGDVIRIGNSFLRLEVAVAGDEVARVSSTSGEDADVVEVLEETGEEVPVEVVEDDGDVVAAEVVDDEEPAEAAVVEDEEEETARPPKGVSERVRLLHEWRDKLMNFSGQKFGHYQISTVLGKGRCGVVFRAEDLKSKQVLALKVFSPQFPYGPQELQRFAGGMKALLPLRHPNLVGLLGAGKTGIYTWITREYVEGENLAAVIRRQAEEERYNEKRACRVGIHVARALDFAHKHRMHHGKISPANILIQETDKVVKVADLMLTAVLKGSQLLQAVLEHRPMSDLSYLSPEEATPGSFTDALSDLYSLGAVIYALLTGRPPFVGDTAEEILEQISGQTRAARPSAFNPDVSPPLEKVVLKLLSKRQEARYQSPAELLADLEPVAEKQGVKV